MEIDLKQFKIVGEMPTVDREREADRTDGEEVD
jgi:hypothetical protein